MRNLKEIKSSHKPRPDINLVFVIKIKSFAATFRLASEHISARIYETETLG
jgi:hypothetical protein